MSYTSALERIGEIETRLGMASASTLGTWRNFDQVLATAQSRFNDKPGPPAASTGTQSSGASSSQSASTLGTATAASRGVASGKHVSGLTPELNEMFTRIAAKHDVPVELVKAVARAESGFKADAVSSAGARGMMQLMPATGAGLGVRDPFNPEQSIEGGARYLKNALKIFHGDVRLAVASYNAGVGAVKRYDGIPPYKETQTYVQRVMSYARQFGLQM